MLSLKYKDIKNRLKFYKRELDKNSFKFFYINAAQKESTRKKLTHFYLRKLNTNYSKTKLQRRCLFTNRAKVSNKVFGISRIRLREMLKFNILPGYTKAVW